MRSSAIAAIFICSGTAVAQPVLITAAQIVSPTQTSITPTAGGPAIALATAEITVRGTILTINGRHTIASLVVERSAPATFGVLTHSANMNFDYSGGAGTDVVAGLELTVTGTVFIQGPDLAFLGSRIDLTACGFQGRQGPGSLIYFGGGGGSGAGHGGAGANGSGIVGGGCYGAFLTPSTFGSGSSGNCCVASSAGGGRIKIMAGGSITIDGDIIADAQLPSGGQSGGGAGGSVHLITSALSGTGTVRARGAAGVNTTWGAGGGGRIAAEFTTRTLADSAFDASGGAVSFGNVRGGAGTVFLKPTASAGTLIIDNKAPTLGEATEFTGAVTVPGNLIVRGGGAIGPVHTDDTFDLTITGDATIDADGALLADERGFLGREGPGTTTFVGGGGGSGAGHGGAGSNGSGIAGGGCYGSFRAPIAMGSGSTGNCCITSSVGGGVLRFTVGGALTNNGLISADGQGPTNNTAGGGAGGSIWIISGALSGTGTVRSRGGSSINTASWGAGGGGRIAAYFTSSTFPAENFDASGGVVSFNNVRGGAGTVFLMPSSGLGTLIIDNKAADIGEATEMTGPVVIPGNLIVRSGGALGPVHTDDTLQISIAGNATIDAGGAILADHRGFPGRQGAGTTSYVGGGGGGGAGHGGAGANGSGILGGDCYGSVTLPITMGSGSTGNCCSAAAAGGGVFRLSVGGALRVDGVLSADGQGPTNATIGGGAGGGIWLTANSLAGTGTIRARGGSGINAASWGGGGGGRIAAYFASSTFPAAGFDASGGVVSFNNVQGGAGTVFLQLSSALGTLIIDNKALTIGEATELTGDNVFGASLVVDNGGLLSPKHGDDTMHLIFGGGATVGPLGQIGADSRGFAARTGTGSLTYVGGGGGSGAGHGGAGSDGSGVDGGGTYGSILAPLLMGSGSSGNCCTPGAAGGGIIRLDFGGAVVVDGLVSANGQPPAGPLGSTAGGGAGGSIWLTCGTLSGTGFIEARGADGLGGSFGAGGGGRVGVYYGTSTFPVANFNLGGGTLGFGSVAGGAGTLFLKPTASRGTVIIDNDSAVGETTELTGEVLLNANLTVRGGGILGPTQADPSLLMLLTGDITIDESGQISADARGFPGRQGPGTLPYAGGGGGGGGGYGGRGGDGSDFTGGPMYGFADLPSEMGSGSSGHCCRLAAAGGGLMQIYTAGTFTVNGRLSANGEGPVNGTTGGGSGGGLLISAQTVTGSGFITAGGGDGLATDFGGGGGGRIAVYSCVLSLPLDHITASGGAGFAPADDGSVVLGASTARATAARACAGSTITLRVVGAGTTGPYQWRFNGVALSDGPLPSGAIVSGALTALLTISGVTPDEEGNYDCVLTGTCGGVTTNVTTFRVCATDLNCDGETNPDDLADYISCYFSDPPCPQADFDRSGNVDPDDLADFISAFFGGCN